MSDLQKLAKMHDHLSHLADKLSALSLFTYTLDKKSYFFTGNNTLKSLIFSSEEAICQAIDIVNEARKDLDEGL